MAITLSEDLSSDNIYTGFWVNQAYGPFRGGCLTLSREAGGLLIAFLALFITVTSNSVWKITRFMLHTIYATPRTYLQDGLHQQRQVLLRNNALPINTALSMLWASKVWRNRTTNVRKRTIPVGALALAVSAISAATGVFSSRLLTNSDNEVLIASPGCGPLQSFHTDTLSYMIGFIPHFSRVVAESTTYAAQCYGQKKGACDMFTSQSLPYQVNKHASCPFQENICKLANNNLLLETGAIDSVEHLGLNDGPRFTAHHRMHCAPLETDLYTTRPLRDNSSRSLIKYFYGSTYGRDPTFTVEVPTDELMTTSKDYVVITQKFRPNSSKVTSDLHQPQADVSLHLLDAFGIFYWQRTEDPWFSATTRPSDRIAGEPNEDKDGDPIFLSDIPGAVVGCASQTYFCNPDLPATVGCVDHHQELLGADREAKTDPLPSIWPIEKDQAKIRPILSFLSSQALSLVHTNPSLLARQSLFGSSQLAPLPVDQWQIEQENFFKGSLALMQFMTLDFAKGSWHDGGLFCGSKDHCERGCHSQKVMSSKHYSFSAWSLGAVLIGGGLIMLIGTFLEDIINLVLKLPGMSSTRLGYAHASWQAESTLQLHRLAHENLGLGSWKRTDEAIPVTRSDVTLAVLDVTDPKHARMVVPDEELEYLSPVQQDASVRARVKYERVPSSAQL